jgi:hypothetical protein
MTGSIEMEGKAAKRATRMKRAQKPFHTDARVQHLQGQCTREGTKDATESLGARHEGNATQGKDRARAQFRINQKDQKGTKVVTHQALSGSLPPRISLRDLDTVSRRSVSEADTVCTSSLHNERSGPIIYTQQ